MLCAGCLPDDWCFCKAPSLCTSRKIKKGTKSNPSQKAIQYYSVAIYAQVGIDGQNTLKYQAINNILALLAQASCVLFIDKVGRRWALIGGNLINSLMFMIATILIATYGTTSSSAGWGFIVWYVNSFLSSGNFFDAHKTHKQKKY